MDQSDATVAIIVIFFCGILFVGTVTAWVLWKYRERKYEQKSAK